MSEPSLGDEHAALEEAFNALVTEHEALEDRPVNVAEHEAHRIKLRAHIDALRTHMRRLRSARDRPEST